MISIYQATNRANGKRYIGITKKSVAARRADHLSNARTRRSCRAFHAALNLYGADSFIWETLETHERYDAGLAREAEMIAALKPEYNISAGGRPGVIGLARSAEWYAKVSASLKGRKPSPERLAEIRAAGEKRRGQPGTNGRRVICLDDGEIFRTGKDAAAFYGVGPSDISAACRGARLTAAGRRFRLVGAEHLYRPPFSTGKRRPVRCLNTGNDYPTIPAAAAALGVSARSIRRVLTGAFTATKAGLRFELLSEAA